MSSHNKTRAEKRAAGLRELSVWLEESARQAIRDEAERQEVSEVLLVTEWAKSLAKAQARRNRKPDTNSLCVPARDELEPGCQQGEPR